MLILLQLILQYSVLLFLLLLQLLLNLKLEVLNFSIHILGPLLVSLHEGLEVESMLVAHLLEFELVVFGLLGDEELEFVVEVLFLGGELQVEFSLFFYSVGFYFLFVFYLNLFNPRRRIDLLKSLPLLLLIIFKLLNLCIRLLLHLLCIGSPQLLKLLLNFLLLPIHLSHQVLFLLLQLLLHLLQPHLSFLHLCILSLVIEASHFLLELALHGGLLLLLALGLLLA